MLWLQQLLRAAGKRVGVDGVFDAGTTRAVRRFQREHGLTQSGTVGDATWRRLNDFRAVRINWSQRGNPGFAKTMRGEDRVGVRGAVDAWAPVGATIGRHERRRRRAQRRSGSLTLEREELAVIHGCLVHRRLLGRPRRRRPPVAVPRAPRVHRLVRLHPHEHPADAQPARALVAGQRRLRQRRPRAPPGLWDRDDDGRRHDQLRRVRDQPRSTRSARSSSASGSG